MHFQLTLDWALVYIVSPTQQFDQVIGWLESSFAKWFEGPAGHEVEHDPVVFCGTKRANDILGYISSSIASRSSKAILPFNSALLRSLSFPSPLITLFLVDLFHFLRLLQKESDSVQFIPINISHKNALLKLSGLTCISVISPIFFPVQCTLTL